MNLRNILGHLLIAIFSFLAAFFGVFNVLFSDIFGLGQQYIAIFMILILYSVLSGLAYLVWPVHGWAWVRWLVIPALLLGGFYLFQEFSSLSWYGVTVLAAVVIGATLGREIISRKRGA